MEGHARTWFTPKQKAELWERWKSGQCVADIARALERRNKSGVYRVLAGNGGIAPAPRRRALARCWRNQGISRPSVTLHQINADKVFGTHRAASCRHLGSSRS